MNEDKYDGCRMWTCDDGYVMFEESDRDKAQYVDADILDLVDKLQAKLEQIEREIDEEAVLGDHNLTPSYKAEITQLQTENERLRRALNVVNPTIVKNLSECMDKHNHKDMLCALTSCSNCEHRDRTWQDDAKDALELGICPICFSNDEAGHRPGCVWGSDEQRADKFEELAKESLRLLQLPMLLIAEEDDNADMHIAKLKQALGLPEEDEEETE